MFSGRGGGAVTAWYAALGPDVPTGPGGVTAWLSGHSWEALEMPEDLGLAVFADLAAGPGTAELGPVVHEIDHRVLWLICPGTSASSWPPPTRLLPSDRWVAVPAADADHRPFPVVRWLHLPERFGQLTDPDPLTAALARHHPDHPSPRAAGHP